MAEYTRRLDGGSTMPQDDSVISLGLGRLTRKFTEPLKPVPPKGRPSFEERSRVEPHDRQQLLRTAMGDAKYFGAWARHRREVLSTRRSRKEENQKSEYQNGMPTSSQEALAWAQELAAEVDGFLAEEAVAAEAEAAEVEATAPVASGALAILAAAAAEAARAAAEAARAAEEAKAAEDKVAAAVDAAAATRALAAAAGAARPAGAAVALQSARTAQAPPPPAAVAPQIPEFSLAQQQPVLFSTVVVRREEPPLSPLSPPKLKRESRGGSGPPRKRCRREASPLPWPILLLARDQGCAATPTF